MTQLTLSSYMAVNEPNLSRKLSVICLAFFENRNKWPQTLDALRTFWGFATPELYAEMWTRFQGAVLSVQEDGSLRVISADGKITIEVLPPKLVGK